MEHIFPVLKKHFLLSHHSWSLPIIRVLEIVSIDETLFSFHFAKSKRKLAVVNTL